MWAPRRPESSAGCRSLSRRRPPAGTTTEPGVRRRTDTSAGECASLATLLPARQPSIPKPITRHSQPSLLLSAVALAFALFGSAGCTDGSRKLPSLALHRCRLPDLGSTAQCGSIEVFEDRSARTGRRIPIRFAVLPALAASPKTDPLFLIVGGPGQSATVSGAPMAAVFSKVNRERDIVMVDQRGTGGSSPLHCEPTSHSLQDVFSQAFEPELVTRCLSELSADPRQYTTRQAIEDLDEVRASLNYERINLWGASYGTRVALAYLAVYPERVRRLVLDGPVPTDIKLPLYSGRDAQRALDRLLSDCKKQPSCAAKFPGLTEKLDELLEDFERGPKSIRVRHPRTGEEETLELSRDGFAASLRMLLYSPQLAAVVPLALDRASEGEFDAFVAAVTAIADRVEHDMYYGMFLSVVCAEDVPRMSESEVLRLSQNNFMGSASLRSLQKACALWPTTTLPESYFAPTTGSAPTLVLSGRDDPIVPPVWGELVAGRLERAVHIIVEGTAHGTSAVACIPDTITAFIAGEQPDRVGASCASKLHRPPFVVSFSGTLP